MTTLGSESYKKKKKTLKLAWGPIYQVSPTMSDITETATVLDRHHEIFTVRVLIILKLAFFFKENQKLHYYTNLFVYLYV